MLGACAPLAPVVLLSCLHLKENAVPKFCKVQTVFFALKDAIEWELNHFKYDGIIEKVRIIQPVGSINNTSTSIQGRQPY